jgi:hypothetical protein
MNTADARITASAFFKSGMFPNLKNEAQAYVLILAGEEMGVGPMEAVTGITLIQGKPTMSANLLAALVKRHPRYDYRVADHSDSTCRIEFIQDGEVSGVSEFTLDDAKKAGLGGNQTWKKYPSALLFARALTQGVRWYAPDVTSSAAYTPEELESDVEPEHVQNTPLVVQTSDEGAGSSNAPTRAQSSGPPSSEPMSELAQLVEEVGFSQEEREALRTWIRQNPEVHAATAVDLLRDSNKAAVMAGVEFEATVET